MPDLKKTGMLLLLLSISHTAAALSSDRHQPVHIEADNMVVNERKGTSHYHGNVRLKQGSLNITADDILLLLSNGQIKKIIISGTPATLSQRPDNNAEPVHSSAGRMEYNTATNRLILLDDARVTQGQNRFSGEKIEYNTINSQVTAGKDHNNGGRVHAIIEPKSEENTPP